MSFESVLDHKPVFKNSDQVKTPWQCLQFVTNSLLVVPINYSYSDYGYVLASCYFKNDHFEVCDISEFLARERLAVEILYYVYKMNASQLYVRLTQPQKSSLNDFNSSYDASKHQDQSIRVEEKNEAVEQNSVVEDQKLFPAECHFSAPDVERATEKEPFDPDDPYAIPPDDEDPNA